MKKSAFLFLLLFFGSAYCFQAKTDVESIVRALYERGAQYVEFSFIDFLGNRKSVLQPVGFFEQNLKKGELEVAIDGSSICGCNRITDSDMLLIPDITTMRFIPWTNGNTKLATVMCNVHSSKEQPYEADPRSILQKAIENACVRGYDFIVGPELEFFMFKANANGCLTPWDNGAYIDATNDCQISTIVAQTLNALNELDVKPQKFHHEVAPGQWEVVLSHDHALAIADRIVVTKDALKTLGKLWNCNVSFMPKPLFGVNGTGMHIHFSLVDHQTGKNLFYDSADPNYLSKTAKAFIAGILYHAREMTLLFNPTVNSYKRLVPGYEAPVYICCGTKNRSAEVRIPQINAGQTQAARGEIRSPDPMCNPYLAFAALLEAGLDGIQNGMTLGELTRDNLFELNSVEIAEKNIAILPCSLEEAIEVFEASDFMKKVLGERMFNTYIAEKKREAKAYRLAVTDWEIKRYL